jgi:hypothetical protein
MNANKLNNIRQIEVHAADPLLPQSSASESEVVCAMLKSYELPVLIQFRQNVFKQELTLHSENHKLITSIRNIEKLPK